MYQPAEIQIQQDCSGSEAWATICVWTSLDKSQEQDHRLLKQEDLGSKVGSVGNKLCH